MADVAASFRARGFVAMQLLTPVELEALRAECDGLNAALEAEGRDLCEEDCVLDVLADLPAETAAARSDADAYFAERLEGRRPEHAAAIRGLLMQRLPAVARLLLDDCEAGGAPCLFNEHYVRKPARVAGPFSWHTDVAHQHEATLALGGASAAPADYISAWYAVRQESASPMTPALRCLDASAFHVAGVRSTTSMNPTARCSSSRATGHNRRATDGTSRRPTRTPRGSQLRASPMRTPLSCPPAQRSSSRLGRGTRRRRISATPTGALSTCSTLQRRSRAR